MSAASVSIHHHQSQLRSEWATVFGRPEDDDRSTRSSHPPLPHPRNRKRQFPLQEPARRKAAKPRKGEISELDERLTPKPSSSRVSSQWKSRVKSQRKSTALDRHVAVHEADGFDLIQIGLPPRFEKDHEARCNDRPASDQSCPRPCFSRTAHGGRVSEARRRYPPEIEWFCQPHQRAHAPGLRKRP